MTPATHRIESAHGAGDMQLPRRSALATLWPLDPQIVFLNHGSFGSCPRWVLEQQREIAMRLEREPIRFIVEEVEGMWDRARGSLARFIGADPDRLAFIANATAGVNTVVRSIRFAPGDELLTNSHEYNACNNALRFAAERDGARVVSVDVPFPIRASSEVVERVLAGVTARTRLVLLSHITSPTGLVFPVEAIVRELNRRGIESLIDGAHAPGMVPIDLASLQPTDYTGNCHKWLCSPKGAAFLWVRADRREAMRPLVISHGANSVRTDRSRFRLEFDYTGTGDFSAALCVPLCIDYLATLHPEGWAGIYRENRQLAIRGRRVLCDAMGVAPPAPEEMLGTMASVPIATRPEGRSVPPTKYHDALQDELIRRWGVQVPIFPFASGVTESRQPALRLVRIACQLYNTIEQVEYLAGALRSELAREASGAVD